MLDWQTIRQQRLFVDLVDHNVGVSESVDVAVGQPVDLSITETLTPGQTLSSVIATLVAGSLAHGVGVSESVDVTVGPSITISITETVAPGQTLSALQLLLEAGALSHSVGVSEAVDVAVGQPVDLSITETLTPGQTLSSVIATLVAGSLSHGVGVSESVNVNVVTSGGEVQGSDIVSDWDSAIDSGTMTVFAIDLDAQSTVDSDTGGFSSSGTHESDNDTELRFTNGGQGDAKIDRIRVEDSSGTLIAQGDVGPYTVASGNDLVYDPGDLTFKEPI